MQLKPTLRIFLLFLFGWGIITPSQICFAQPLYTHYSTINGLSGSDVTAICQDNNYLWIATNNGLNRFDGQSFKPIIYNGTKKDVLAGSNIETLMFDSHGRLWIGLTNGGAEIYNPRTNTFKHIGELTRQYPKRVITIYEDSFGNIWLGSWEDGLYQLTPTHNGERYKVVRHFPSNTISALFEKPKGKLWIGTYNGYFLYDILKKKIVPLSVNHLAVTQIAGVKDHSVLLSSWGKGLTRVSWNNNMTSFSHEIIFNDLENIFRFVSDNAGHLVMGPWGKGVYEGSITSTNMHKWPVNISMVTSFHKDFNNRLWVGTCGQGLYCFQGSDRNITEIHQHSLSDFNVISILPIDGVQTLVGTQGNGLFLYSTSNNSFSPFLTGQASFFKNCILSLYRDNDIIIIGDDDMGINYMPSTSHLKASDVKRFGGNGKIGKVTSIAHINNTYWIGTKQFGVFSMKYDFVTKTFYDLKHYEKLGNNQVKAIVPNGQQLLIAGFNGLVRFDPKKNKVTHIASNTTLSVNSMVAQDDKKIWLGTSVGLRLLETAGKDTIITPSSIATMPQESIEKVLIDGNDNLWCVGINHVFVGSLKDGTLKEINLDLFPKRGFNTGEFLSTSTSSVLMIGDTEGMYLIDTNRLLSTKDKSRLVLNQLMMDNEPIEVGKEYYGNVILHESPEYIKALCLPYQGKWISLSFSEINTSAFHGLYEYLVKGFTKEWRHLDLSKPLTFSQLPPGEYTLLIRSASIDKENSVDAVVWKMALSVRTPWWMTTWFKVTMLLLVLLIIGLIGLYARHIYLKRQYIRIKRMEREKRDAILQEKDNFLSGLSHDLLTTCSLILAPVKDLLRDKTINPEQKEKLDIVSKNADYLSNLFQTIRDYRSVETTNRVTSKNEVDLVANVRMSVDAFGYIARKNNIQLTYKPTIKRLTVATDILMIERVLYNLIGNAIKYSKAEGSVCVTLDFDPETKTVSIGVSDNGVGIEKNKQDKIFHKYYRGNEESTPGLGLGLYTAKRFAEKLGGSIKLNSEVGVGTTFVFTFPVELVDISEPKIPDKNEEKDFMVLIVEDNEQLRNYLVNKISKYFNVRVASNGVEALECIKKELPEFVLSDVMMPGIDGLTLCRTIKSTPQYADIFVMLLTAKSLTEDEILGYKAGADFYITKPFDSDVLISQMQNVYSTLIQNRRQVMSNMLANSNQITDESTQDVFLKNAYQIVSQHIDDELFSVEQLANELGMSKTVLYRKFKLLLNDTPNSWIKTIRLKRAVSLLQETNLSVSEIAYRTGFSQAQYFIKCFKDTFGETPNKYRKFHNQ